MRLWGQSKTNRLQYTYGRSRNTEYHSVLNPCLVMDNMLMKMRLEMDNCCRPEHAPHRFKHIPVSPYRVDEPIYDQQVGQHHDKRKNRRIKLILSEQEQDRDEYKQRISYERGPTEDRVPFAQR